MFDNLPFVSYIRKDMKCPAAPPASASYGEEWTMLTNTKKIPHTGDTDSLGVCL